LITNIDDSLEPTFQNKYVKSMVITKYGRPIGIIGVTTTFPSNWGKLRILPEAQAVKDEATKMKDDGINIVIVLSHCGLEVDRDIAKHAGDIDIIVGGHSHSFLYSGDNPPGPDRPVDTYPTIEKQENGHNVLIVQASAYTKDLGDITLYFDEEGIVKNYEGAPIFLGNDVVPDSAILAELAPWKAGIDEIQNKVIGKTKFDLIASKCYVQECVMGNLMADVMAAAVSLKSKLSKSSLQISFSLVS
jgi:5'-nucleotidase